MDDDWFPSPDIPSLDRPWKRLSVGKLVKSWSRLKRIIEQASGLDVWQVCGHLHVGSGKLPFIQVEIVVVTNTREKLPPLSHTQPFCFQFSRNVKTKKEELYKRLIPPSLSSLSLQIWLFLYQTKTNPLHWSYGIEKHLDKCKIWGAHNHDNKNWAQFRPLKGSKN